jgi:putative ABC transport system permease protein
MAAGRLVVGLAWRNVRHRPWQALLLLLALSVATTTITLTLALVDVSDRSWERVSQATNGSHVGAGVDILDMSPAQRERARAELAELGDAPG